MNHVYLGLAAVVSWLSCAVHFAAAGPPSADYVANLFGYSGEMQQEDFSDAARRRNPGVIWSVQYSTPQDELAVTTITLAQGKTLLTDALREQYEKMSVQELKLPSGEPMPRAAQPIALQNGATGFVYLAGFGPGGSGYDVVITSPDQAFDLSISIAFSSSIEASRMEKLQSHYDGLARNSGGGMLKLLESTMTAIYPRIAADYQDQSTPNVAAGSGLTAPSIAPKSLSAASPAAQSSAAPAAAVNRSNRVWVLLVATVAVAVIGFLIWKTQA